MQKYVVSLVMLLVLASCTHIFASTLAYWQFENDYSDSSGNGYTMTPAGTPSFETDIASNAPGSYSVTNSSTTKILSNYITPARDYTVEFFFKTSQSTTGYILSTYDHTFGDGDPANGGWAIGITSGAITLSSVANTSTLYNDNAWHHLAFTFASNDDVNLYIDGNIVISATAPAKYSYSFRNPI